MQTNILEYLERTVRRLPEKIAYTDGTYGLTFREVYGAARSVGSFLAAEGFYREPVVVYMKKPRCHCRVFRRRLRRLFLCAL